MDHRVGLVGSWEIWAQPAWETRSQWGVGDGERGSDSAGRADSPGGLAKGGFTGDEEREESGVSSAVRT